MWYFNNTFITLQVNLMAAPFGNTNGRKGKVIEHQLRQAAAGDDYKRVRQGCEKMLNLYAKGDPFAVTWVRDTLDGRPTQRLDVGSDDNALTSLQVLFVQSIQDHTQPRLTIDQPALLSPDKD